MTASLILVRHAAPRIVETEAPTRWALSGEGRAAAARLAKVLRALAPVAIIASPEPKADETARIIAEELGLSVQSEKGLVEHKRPGLGFVDAAKFESAVRGVFEQPSERLFEGESADEAAARFEEVLARYSQRPLVVVTHGTVLSICISRWSGIDAFALWSSLKLPEAIVLDANGNPLRRVTV